MAEVDANNNVELPNGKVNEESFLEVFANLKEEDLIRGTRPENLEKQCLELCQTYIGGSWNEAKGVEDVLVKRITGGLTNQLYKVELKESVPRAENSIYREAEPTAVAIKLYEPKHMANYEEGEDERLNDIIILTILSEVGLGPKVYGIFSNGFIQAYHDHDQFTLKQQQNPKLFKEVVNAMARIHYLNVPIQKSKESWNLREIKKCLDFGYEHCRLAELAEELDLPLLKNRDVRKEFEGLKRIHDSMKAPKVFSHCDFRSMNILVTKPDQQILLVDLEYSSYLPRAYDMATFMMEWGNERFDFKNMGIPEESALEMFTKLYIEACDKLEPGYSSKPGNEVATIVKEIKVFILTQYMFFLGFLARQQKGFIDAVPFDPKSNAKYVEDIYKKYFEIKEIMVKDGVISDF